MDCRYLSYEVAKTSQVKEVHLEAMKAKWGTELNRTLLYFIFFYNFITFILLVLVSRNVYDIEVYLKKNISNVQVEVQK
jgi:hypothetical protein